MSCSSRPSYSLGHSMLPIYYLGFPSRTFVVAQVLINRSWIMDARVNCTVFQQSFIGCFYQRSFTEFRHLMCRTMIQQALHNIKMAISRCNIQRSATLVCGIMCRTMVQ